jgi:hypothetical protein
MRCIPKLGLVVSQQTSQFPLPKDTPSGGKRKWSDKNVAGPDFIVYTTPQQAVDITIVNPTIEARGQPGQRVRCCLTRAVQKKKDTYERAVDETLSSWEDTYDMKCRSFVMSTNGFFHRDSQQLLFELAKERGPWFTSWVELRLQKVLCEAMGNIYHMMQARKKATPYVTVAASMASQTSAP